MGVVGVWVCFDLRFFQAQHEAEERVEALRIKLMEERRQRTAQRHLDQADRFEAQGKISDAIDEYRFVRKKGGCVGFLAEFSVCKTKDWLLNKDPLSWRLERLWSWRQS